MTDGSNARAAIAGAQAQSQPSLAAGKCHVRTMHVIRASGDVDHAPGHIGATPESCRITDIICPMYLSRIVYFIPRQLARNANYSTKGFAHRPQHKRSTMNRSRGLRAVSDARIVENDLPSHSHGGFIP